MTMPSRQLIARAGALLALSLLSMLAPSMLRAQISACPCATIPLTVQSDVSCRVTFIIHHPSGLDQTVTVSPGTTVNIPCEVGLKIDVVECGSNPVPVPIGGCLININTDTLPVCCVDVCFQRNGLGCWAVLVRPTISASATCPCH
jgi:hypothetical protein